MMKDLCNLFDYRDLRGLVSSIAKKLKDDKYFMIEFPIPSLDSVYHFILIHFFSSHVLISRGIGYTCKMILV